MAYLSSDVYVGHTYEWGFIMISIRSVFLWAWVFQFDDAFKYLQVTGLYFFLAVLLCFAFKLLT